MKLSKHLRELVQVQYGRQRPMPVDLLYISRQEISACADMAGQLEAENQSQKKEIEGLHELLGEVDELLQNSMFTGYEDMAVRDNVHNVCTYLAARRRATGEGQA